MAGVGPIAKAGTMNWLNAMNPMIAQLSSIMQGQGSPQDLPWFKNFEETLMQKGQDQDTELIKQAIARGLSGNSLAGVLGQAQNARNTGILNTIRDMYTNAPKQLMSFGQPIADFFLKHKSMMMQAMAQQDAQSQSGGSPLDAIMKIAPMAMGAIGGPLAGLGTGILSAGYQAFSPTQTQSTPSGPIGQLNLPPMPPIDWSQFQLK